MLSTFILSERDLYDNELFMIVRSDTLHVFFQEVRWNTQLQGLRGGRAQSLEGVSRTL